MIYSKIKQYYRYRRNWKKLQSRQSKISKGQHFTKELDFYSHLIKENDLCFDIGANIGDKTNIFLQLGAKVIAVEPQENCWRVLKRRFKEEDKVIVEMVAIADKKGHRTLFIDKSPTISSISEAWISAVKRSGRFSSHKWSQALSVNTSTLDDLIKKYGKPAFCKIDVEGYEFEVLKVLSQPLNVISFEFVSERIEPSLKCIDHLSQLGQAKYNYYLGEAMSFASPNWLGPEEMKSVLNKMKKVLENYGDIYVRFVNHEQKTYSISSKHRKTKDKLDVPF